MREEHHPLRKLVSHPKKYDRRSMRTKKTREDNIMRSFYNGLDFPEFKSALRLSKDPKFQMLLYAISNPRLRLCSFPEICKRCDLTINDVSTLWRDHQLSKGIMEVMSHVPQVMVDVAIDSKSRTVKCPDCNGEGRMPEGEKHNKMEGAICKRCYGDGSIRILGDKDSRNLLFESVGLKKGNQINQTTNINMSTSFPSLEDVISDAEKALDIVATEVEDGEIRDRAEEAFRDITDDHSTVGDEGGQSLPPDSGVPAPTISPVLDSDEFDLSTSSTSSEE